MPKPPIQIPRNAGEMPLNCDVCKTTGSLAEQLVESCINVREEEINCEIPKMVCSSCGAAFATIPQADRGIEIAVACYQENHSLLTGKLIAELRKQQGLIQRELASQARVGIASIKRWESGRHVQTEANDAALRKVLETGTDFELSDYVTVSQGSVMAEIMIRFSSPHPVKNPAIRKLKERPVEVMAYPWGISDVPLAQECYA